MINTSSLQLPSLVLNKSWLAINVTSAKRALKTVISDRAKIVCPETYTMFTLPQWMEQNVDSDEFCIETVAGKFKAPRIIVVNEYNKFPKREVVFSRKNLWKRDGYQCQYCGKRPKKDEISVDHIVPRSQGGQSSFPNCVLACTCCNMKKDNRTPQQAGMKLLKKPEIPQWSPLYSLQRITLPKEYIESWSKFVKANMDYLYWNIELE